MGRERRTRGSSLVVTWGSGLRPTMKKGGDGGQSLSGMALRARRIENGDQHRKRLKRARSLYLLEARGRRGEDGVDVEGAGYRRLTGRGIGRAELAARGDGDFGLAKKEDKPWVGRVALWAEQARRGRMGGRLGWPDELDWAEIGRGRESQF
jgi:hypothetical protein